MTSYKSRLIPGIYRDGRFRGGGSESISWIREGPLFLQREYSEVIPGMFDGWPDASLAGKSSFNGNSAPLLDGNPNSDVQVRVNGTEAVSRSNPTSPSVNLLTSAGELAQDGVPSPADYLRWEKTTRGILKDTSGKYVGVHFGWLPLLEEIRQFCINVKDSDKILAEAKKRDSMKVIKVGYTFPSTVETNSYLGTTLAFRWDNGVNTGNPAQCRVFQQNKAKTWFEAEYVHLLPITRDQLDSSATFAQKAKHILGLHLTPETLWELAPWSWAVDWFSNFGDVLASVTNILSDGLVMRDAFVMHHFRKYAEVVDITPHMWFTHPIASPSRVTSVYEVKKRFPSIPYFGFGAVGELTPRQISILAALGISRA